MPNGHPDKYWPRTSTLVREIPAPTFTGQDIAKPIYSRNPALEPCTARSTRSARYYLDETFRMCGGVEGFAKWAKSNPNEFYPLYIKARVPRPLPTTEDDNGEAGVTIIIQASTNDAASKQVTQAGPQAPTDLTV